MVTQDETINPTYGELTDNETAVLISLLQPGTVTEAADRAGVSRGTVYRYLADDRFKAALRNAQNSAIEAAISLLSGEARDAAQTLIDIHKDKNVADGVRVQAARYVLVENLKIREQHELAERLERIEQMLGVHNG